MRRYSKGLIIAAVLGTLAACGPDATTGSPATADTAAAQTEAAAPKPPLPTGGKCVLLTEDKAVSLVGSAVTSSSTNVTGGEGIVHVDGCTYIGGSSNLGYAVNHLKGAGMTATTFITQAKAAMAAQPGVTPFDASGADDAIAFTVPIGGKVMARIEAAKGTYTVAVNSTAADAETAKKISTSALAILLTALS